MGRDTEQRGLSWRTLVAATSVLVLGGTVLGCGRSEETARPARPEPRLIELLRGVAAGASSIRPYDSVTDLLDNVVYDAPGRPPGPYTQGVVVGTVTDVSPGRAFKEGGEAAPDGIEIDFNDPQAVWRTVHVSVDVNETISGDVGTSATFGIAADPAMALDRIQADLRKMGPLLLFLDESQVFAYEKSVFGTVQDGTMIGTIGDDGRLAFPALENEEERRLLRDARTLQELRAAREEPPRTIRLNSGGEVIDE